MLLDYARLTGDAAGPGRGARALDYMAAFRVPRGAQTWEVPLHTPDQLASAYAVWRTFGATRSAARREYLA